MSAFARCRRARRLKGMERDNARPDRDHSCIREGSHQGWDNARPSASCMQTLFHGLAITVRAAALTNISSIVAMQAPKQRRTARDGRDRI